MIAPHTHASGRDVAVIGAGPGGLAAAMVLAGQGATVTVYESRQTVGGRTSRVEATGSNGITYRFDRGPTFFLMPYVLAEIFAALGERLEDHVELVRLDPMYRLLIGQNGSVDGGLEAGHATLDATQDIANMARRIAAINERDGANFERFVADQRTKLRLSEPILRSPMRSPLDLAKPETLKVLPMLKVHKSVHDLLGEYFKDERVKLAVSFQSKYLGMSPFECPSLFTILPLIEYEYGIWHPIGGCHAICEAMASVLRSRGVDIRLDEPVRGITLDGQRATGVATDRGETKHDAVVVNADATWALKHLVPEQKRQAGEAAKYADDKLDAKRYSCSTYMLYLGVEGAVDLPHHTIHTSATYRENLLDITDRKRLSSDLSMYVCNPSVTDPTLAPEGHSSLYVLVPTPNCQAGADGPIDWAREAPVVRRRVFEKLASVYGLPDLEQRVRAEVQLTPDDWAAMGINHGATFNLAHNLTQMLHWRPQNRLKGFERLYLVGGGTHPGSGLPTIFLSSQITAGLLGRDLGLHTPAGRVQAASPA